MNTKNDYHPFLMGERLYLREIRLSDVNDCYYRWMNNPEITKYLDTRFYPYSMESLQEYVKSSIGNPNEVFFAIIVKDNNKHIGNIKLGQIDWINRKADIGILIGERDYWGQGYATEAIKIIVNYAFNTLNLHKLTAGSYAPNKGSTKAFQKAGFEIEGVRKEQSFSNGKYMDGILLGLINSNFDKNEPLE